MPGTFQAVYNGTKPFLDAFSFALRAERKASGVTVTCVMPDPRTPTSVRAPTCRTSRSARRKGRARAVSVLQRGVERGALLSGPCLWAGTARARGSGGDVVVGGVSVAFRCRATRKIGPDPVLHSTVVCRQNIQCVEGLTARRSTDEAPFVNATLSRTGMADCGDGREIVLRQSTPRRSATPKQLSARHGSLPRNKTCSSHAECAGTSPPLKRCHTDGPGVLAEAHARMRGAL